MEQTRKLRHWSLGHMNKMIIDCLLDRVKKSIRSSKENTLIIPLTDLLKILNKNLVDDNCFITKTKLFHIFILV